MKTFADLSERPPNLDIPWLDRADVDLKSLTEKQRFWHDNGVLLVDDAVSESDLSAYENWRAKRGIPDALGALPISFGYQYVKEIRNVALSKKVYGAMLELFKEPMAAHFDLTQWKSTERAWHQDDYLNDEKINGHYAAVWFAIQDIHPDAGPFEFVRGSNLWPVMRRSKIKALMDPKDAESPSWPSLSQNFVGDVFAQEISKNGIAIEKFLGRRGQALIWHARLVHRGSLPKDPSLARKALIVHYTAVSKTDPNIHEIRYSHEGIPYIRHKMLEFRDWPDHTGIKPHIPD